jgi:hypothetical protein
VRQIPPTATKAKPSEELTKLRERIDAKPPAAAINWFNSMIHGETGVGKTHLIGTAADHPLTSPVLIADVDGGVSTLRKRQDIDVVPVRKFIDLVNLYKDLKNAIPTDGSRFPYGTVAIDTFSEFQSLDLADIAAGMARLNDNLDPDIPDQRAYGKSLSHMRDIIRVYRDLPCNTIFTCHTNTERDNNMRLTYEPKLTGQMKKLAPGFFDIVGYYWAERDGDVITRKMQFVRTETTVAKDRTGAFEAIEVDPTIPSLWDKLQATN